MHVASPAITQAKYAHLVLLKAQLPRQHLHYRACMWGQAGVLPSNLPHAATCSKLCDCCASLPACLAAPCAMFTFNHNQQKTAFAHSAYISVSSINVICMCANTIFLKRFCNDGAISCLQVAWARMLICWQLELADKKLRPAGSPAHESALSHICPFPNHDDSCPASDTNGFLARHAPRPQDQVCSGYTLPHYLLINRLTSWSCDIGQGLQPTVVTTDQLQADGEYAAPDSQRWPV